MRQTVWELWLWVIVLVLMVAATSIQLVLVCGYGWYPDWVALFGAPIMAAWSFYLIRTKIERLRN